MTVLATDSSKRFQGSGNAGPFTWDWRFLSNADISVYLIPYPYEDLSLEVRQLLVEGVDYTLTGARSYQGGRLFLTNVLPEGPDLYVERNTSAIQGTDIRNQGDFSAETHEDVFDQLAMIAQDRDREVIRKTEVIERLTARVAIAESAKGIAAADGTGRFFTIQVVSDGPDANQEEILYPKIIPL